MQRKWILASDIDYTLTGDPVALAELNRQLQTQRQQGDLFLILSTGRRLDQVLDGFATEGIPRPDAIVSQVGTEIFLPPFTHDADPLPEWDRRLKERFSRATAEHFLQDIPGLRMQPERFNTALKVSCYLDETLDPDAAARRIQQRVVQSGKDDVYQVIWSSGRDLDIIPAAAGKGKAIHFVIDYLNLAPETVIVAGDTGNDRTMFAEFGRGIVVANAQPELKALREEPLPDTAVFFANQKFAAGVAEGLRHFGVLQA